MSSKFASSWRSPITTKLLTEGKIGLSSLKACSATGRLFWLESRPMEAGRNVLCSFSNDKTTELLGNARTRVHEYGGAAYTVLGSGDRVVHSEFVGQHLRVGNMGTGEYDPSSLTPENGGCRFADGCFDEAHNRVVMVRETDAELSRDVVNDIVAVDLSGAATSVLVSGKDFYSYPRLSPDGRSLAYVAWDHPNMPWDDTALFIATLDGTGSATGEPLCVTSGGSESVCQPTWSPDGSRLVFLSDCRAGWYNLHVYTPASGASKCVLPRDSESCSSHQGWTLGLQSFHFLDDENIILVSSEEGKSVISKLNLRTEELTPLPLHSEVPCNIAEIAVRSATEIAVIAGGPQQSPAVYTVDFTDPAATPVALRQSFNLDIDRRYLPTPRHVAFPSDNGLEAHGFFYAPCNPDYSGGSAAEGGQPLPPLLVKIHGGPTAGTSTTFRLDIAYWTSRGFAVLDVDYGTRLSPELYLLPLCA
jgi:dipeptidyl aminopeptidase/acylaminoacyl peptidase